MLAGPLNLPARRPARPWPAVVALPAWLALCLCVLAPATRADEYDDADQAAQVADAQDLQELGDPEAADAPLLPEDADNPSDDALMNLPPAVTPPAPGPYAAALLEMKIKPDGAGILAHLKALPPGTDGRQKAVALLEQLASPDADAREAAAKALVALPVVPADDLRDAARSDDPELRARARQVLLARSAGNPAAATALACFRELARQKVRGAAETVLAALPCFTEEFVLAAGRDALRATATPDDVPLLTRAALRGPAEARVAAIGALAAVAGRDGAQPVRKLLADPDDRVRLAAARALADGGDRACLAPLVDLLACDDLRVRYASAGLLRALTGRSSDYVPWIEPADQAAALDGWKHWLADQGPTCPLTYPLPARQPDAGRTLVCLYARNEIVEYDAAGRETFRAAEAGACPWACQGLADGGRLIALYSANAIVEYGPDGKVRNRFEVPGGPMSVARLENGNTLAACNNAQKVVEVNPHGQIVWETAIVGGPCDAARLENGNTLITLQNANAVVEVDRAGKEIWRVEGLHTPRSASRLDSGNTLVCDLGSGRVVEFDPTGREAWAQGNFSSPFAAQRLSSGTTVVSDTQSIKEIDHTGRTISENKMQSLGRVWRY